MTPTPHQPDLDIEALRKRMVAVREDGFDRFSIELPELSALLVRLERAEADVPNGYKLVMVPNGPAPDAPDYNEAKRQADMATGVEGPDSAWLSIFIREINRWCHHRAEAAAGAVPEGFKLVPITDMAEDDAKKWAWDTVRRDCSDNRWTVGESGTYYGFFLHGWHYRKQYESQRAAAPPAQGLPAAPEVECCLTISNGLDACAQCVAGNYAACKYASPAAAPSEPVDAEILVKWIMMGCPGAELLSNRRIMSQHIRNLTTPPAQDAGTGDAVSPIIKRVLSGARGMLGHIIIDRADEEELRSAIANSGRTE